jgi:hypothetical protein
MRPTIMALATLYGPVARSEISALFIEPSAIQSTFRIL